MRESNTVFHIGLHKTGTTFLQHDVFPKIEGVSFISNGVYELLTSPPENKKLVSCELLCGHPWRGGWFEEFRENVENIGEVHPESKCIIGFRRHDKLVKSLYKQYLHEGNTGGVDKFFSPDGTGLMSPADLGFRRRLELIEKHFAGMLVYTQEELKNNFKEFLRRLGKFLNAHISLDEINRNKKNVGIKTKFQVRLLRSLNRIDSSLQNGPLPTLHNRLFRILNITPRSLVQNKLKGIGWEQYDLPEEVSNYLGERFSDDWKYIQEVKG